MSTLEALDLKARFPVPTRQEWEEAAQAELKDTPLAKLTRRNLEGLEIRPLSMRADIEGRPLGIPLAAKAWQPVDAPAGSAVAEPGAPLLAVPLALEDEAAATLLREGLASGETAADLHFSGDPGLLEGVLAGFRAPLFVSGPADPLTVLQNLPEGVHQGALFCEPLTCLARTGGLAMPLEAFHDRMAQAVRQAERSPGLAVLGVDGGPWHEGGADVAQQLGWTLATALEAVRAMTARGLDLQAVLNRIAFSFTVSPRLFPETARLRAARRLWARIADLLGGRGAARIVARSGRLHRSAWDPYTNLVRSTVEAFAALAGGADAICLEPMDAAAGGGLRPGRRHARNQLLVLLEEGALHRVLDPGAGSASLEVLTDEVSRQAWTHFQAIEQAGGMTAAVRAGLPQREAAATFERRRKALVTGRASLVGVSHYAVRSEPPAAAERPQGHPAPAGTAVTVTPVEPQRLAAAFEDLRRRTWTIEQRRGRPVVALMAPLGGSGLSRVRAQFCVTFLGAAGLRTESSAGFDSVATALEECRSLQADLLVLCAEDGQYAGLLEQLGEASGDRPQIAIAGLPPEADRLRQLGADLFIHRDADRVETSGEVLARLEAR